jgi:hypothetical protein
MVRLLVVLPCWTQGYLHLSSSIHQPSITHHRHLSSYRRDLPAAEHALPGHGTIPGPGTKRELGDYSLAGIYSKLCGEAGHVCIVHSPRKYQTPIHIYMHRKDASFVPVQRMLPLMSAGKICTDAHSCLVVPPKILAEDATAVGTGGGGGSATQTDNSGEANKTLTFVNVTKEYGYNCVDKRGIASFSAEVDSVPGLAKKLWGAERTDSVLDRAGQSISSPWGQSVYMCRHQCTSRTF